MNELDTLNMSLRRVKGKSGQKLTKCSLRGSFEQETRWFLKGLNNGNILAMVMKYKQCLRKEKNIRHN